MRTRRTPKPPKTLKTLVTLETLKTLEALKTLETLLTLDTLKPLQRRTASEIATCRINQTIRPTIMDRSGKKCIIKTDWCVSSVLSPLPAIIDRLSTSFEVNIGSPWKPAPRAGDVLRFLAICPSSAAPRLPFFRPSSVPLLPASAPLLPLYTFNSVCSRCNPTTIGDRTAPQKLPRVVPSRPER